PGAVERVVRRFLQLQGEDLNEGLVFREYVEFEQVGRHLQSRLPLAREFRLFLLDGALVYRTEYWESAHYGEEAPPLDRFATLAARVESRFFTMDVAKRLDGDWLVVELGDGQVAGLPDHADPAEFYAALAERWPSMQPGPGGGDAVSAARRSSREG